MAVESLGCFEAMWLEDPAEKLRPRGSGNGETHCKGGLIHAVMILGKIKKNPKCQRQVLGHES